MNDWPNPDRFFENTARSWYYNRQIHRLNKIEKAQAKIKDVKSFHKLYSRDQMYNLLFVIKEHGIIVRCFWGYDIKWEIWLTKQEARKLYRRALYNGYEAIK